jgi:hypothetical protein
MYKEIKYTDAGAVEFNMQNFGGVFTLSQIEFEMMQMYATNLQKKTYAWVARLLSDEKNLLGYQRRCECAPEEAGNIRKYVRNLKNLQTSLWDTIDADEVVERLDYFIFALKYFLKNYAERTERIHNMH